jgi:hypothetical protein
MMSHVEVACPYCGEWVALAIDASAGDQCYVEDCQVCCRPMRVDVVVDGMGDGQVRASRDDDA